MVEERGGIGGCSDQWEAGMRRNEDASASRIFLFSLQHLCKHH